MMRTVFFTEAFVFTITVMEDIRDGNGTLTKVMLSTGQSGGQPMLIETTDDRSKEKLTAESEDVEIQLVGEWERESFYKAMLTFAKWIEKNRKK